VRFFRHGTNELVKSVLDVRDNGLTDTDTKVQPVVEVRALRPWEDFDEGIVRFGSRFVVGAIAAEFSAIAFGPPEVGGLSQASPKGTIICIDRIFTRARAVGCLVPRATVVGTYTETSPIVSVRDTRWGPGGAIAPNQDLKIFVGSDPVGFAAVSQTGDDFEAATQYDNIGIVLGGKDTAWVVQGTVVNTQLEISFSGRIWRPKD